MRSADRGRDGETEGTGMCRTAGAIHSWNCDGCICAVQVAAALLHLDLYWRGRDYGLRVAYAVARPTHRPRPDAWEGNERLQPRLPRRDAAGQSSTWEVDTAPWSLSCLGR